MVLRLSEADFEKEFCAIDDIEKQVVLGEGAAGKVYAANNKLNGEKIAMKVLKNIEDDDDF